MKNAMTKTVRYIAAMLAMLSVFALSGCANQTKQLVANHPIEMIIVETIGPFDPLINYRYEITPDLTVRWYEFDPTDWSDDAELWGTSEKTITQQKYDAIANAIISNNFLSLPEQHEAWKGFDGPSQDIEIVVDGTTYHSGGYFPEQTSKKFANIWNAFKDAGVFDEEGYARV